MLAWHVTAGTWKGTDLAGVSAAAAVSLSTTTWPRRPRTAAPNCVVDGSAAQAAAFADLLAARCGTSLGPIVAVRRWTVSFQKDGRAYTCTAGGFAELSIEPMPNDACCSQPSLVWYARSCRWQHRKVGYAQTAAYTAGTLGDPWQRADENDAFYGAFSL